MKVDFGTRQLDYSVESPWCPRRSTSTCRIYRATLSNCRRTGVIKRQLFIVTVLPCSVFYLNDRSAHENPPILGIFMEHQY